MVPQIEVQQPVQQGRCHHTTPASPPLPAAAVDAAAELQQELVAKGERAWDVVQGEAPDSRTSRDLGRVFDDAGRARDEAGQAVRDAGKVVDELTKKEPEY
jgi:hypothetical protein